jgi:RNA polymerase sigma factor (sigma-70 family)
MQQQPGTAYSDLELLRAYAERQSDAAFSEIVSRYKDMVYSAAFRQVGNAATAEDLTQAVFIVLSRKAGALRSETVLSGWLFRAVRFAAMDTLKTTRRREHRETEASVEAEDDSAAQWEEIAPLLDDGLAALGEQDRLAILLRFFDQKSWSEVGAALRMNENAARVRVTRALDKLRFWFSKRGVSVSALALAGLLTSNAVQAAPAVIAGTASSVATALAGTIARKWLIKKAMTISLGVLILLGLLGGGGIWLNRNAEEQREQRAQQEAADLRAIDAAIGALDNDLYNTRPAFIGAIFLRPAHENLRPVFQAYAQAFGGLRDELRVRFPDRQVRYGAFRTLLDELLRGQPTPARTYVNGDRGGSAKLRRCTIEFVRVNGVWKWDYFGALTPEAAANQIAMLKHKTDVMGRLTQQLRAGDLADSREFLKHFEND